ncbi:MAG: hypothetical protein ACLFQV_04430 [Vulcanimicrobiota bacterium]
MKRTSIILLITILTLVISSAGFAEDTNDYLIVPAKRVGIFELGKPVPQAAFKTLGKPDKYVEPSPGGEGVDTGLYFWKAKLLVKLNDGVKDNNIFQIMIISPKYKTAKGIGRGSSFEDVKKAYPNGETIETMDSDFAWNLPGIFFAIDGGKVSTLGISPEF